MKELAYDSRKLEALCREYHVKRLAIFGSVLRGEDTPASDLDLLVEFQPENIPGLFRFFDLQHEFTQLFGKSVDLNTLGFLNGVFRDEVKNHAQSIYAE